MQLESNPFAILTFIAAPAILTNASSVLALGTSNRFGRNVDRMREIIKLLEDGFKSEAEEALLRRLLDWMETRTELLMRAMSLFYFAIGCFAGGSLMSLAGSIVSSTRHLMLLTVTLFIAGIAGVGGLGGLVSGGLILVRETRLALATIREESRFYRSHYAQRRSKEDDQVLP